MPWRPDWSLTPAAADRGLFDQTIGELILDGSKIGHVAFRLMPWASREAGHLWWKRFRLEEVVEWMETPYPSDQASYRDGISPSGNLAESIRAARWDPQPFLVDETQAARVELRMLDAAERDNAWRSYGW